MFGLGERSARLLLAGSYPEVVPSGRDRRGVSDTIGFVFVFALIVSAVGLVTVVGMGSLQDARDYEQVNNAERAFEVLSDNVEDLRREEVPSRATEIKLGGASVRTGDPIMVNVTASGASASASTGNLSMTPIVYEADTGEQIRYVNGAIVRSNDQASWMVDEPALLLGSNRTMVPVLWLRADQQRSLSGDRTVHIRTVHTSTDLSAADTGDTYDTVTIRMETPNADLWADYYTRQGMSCTQPTEDTIDCTKSGLDRVYVTTVGISVGFG